MKNKYSFYTFYLSAFLIVFGMSNKASAQITSYPYLETFGASGCALPTGYSNSGSDPWDFQNTSETYMEGLDHTSNGGCFASMDDSGGAVNDSCLLTTPTFNLTSVPAAQLRFWWQNSNSTTSTPATSGPRPWSDFHVDISTNGGTTWTRNVWSVTDSQQIGWAEAVVNLSSYISSTTVIRFRGQETQSFRSDLSLDDIKVFEPQAWDAQLNSIVGPTTGGCGDSAASVIITVQNNGTNTITSLPVSYSLNGTLIDTDTITSSILSNATHTHTFSVPANLLSPGNYALKTWARLALDPVFTNDTLESSVMTAPTVTSYPYFQDFENGQEGWAASGTASSWAFGTPAKTTITGASSGSNAFVTGGLGTTQYNMNENSEVSGPCFDFTSAEGTLWLSFDVWWNSENNWDGTVIQYSIDTGATWVNIGASGDPNNWFNNSTIFANPGGQASGWSGRVGLGSGGWVQAKHALPSSLKNLSYVLFRVAFASDGSVADDGFGFDDFAIVDYTTVSIDSHQVLYCGIDSINQVLYASGIKSWGDYLWSTSDTTDSIVVTTGGTYSVVFTDTILNTSSNASTTIDLFDLPIVSLLSLADSILLDDSVTLVHATTNPNFRYLWTPGNDTTPTKLVRGIDFGAGLHTFNLEVTDDSTTCVNDQDATVLVVDITGIDELSSTEIRLFPNPVSDVLNIQLNGIEESDVQLELFTMNGQLITTVKGNTSTNNSLSIDMSSEKPGAYMLVITSNNKKVVNRIIKQ